MAETSNSNSIPAVEVRNLTIGYQPDKPLMKNLNFSVQPGEIFGILGNSGCGKSTLLKHIIGLFEPLQGEIKIGGRAITGASRPDKFAIARSFGVTYQGGALFGSMSVGRNIALPLEEHTTLAPEAIAQVVAEKLELVGLGGYGDYMPAELSGGMRKRAGLARALVLEPKLLFFDEPSAGLDPISAAELDQLILTVRRRTGATVVIVTHELDSIFAITDRVIIMDRAAATIVADGNPRELKTQSNNRFVRAFLNRETINQESNK